MDILFVLTLLQCVEISFAVSHLGTLSLLVTSNDTCPINNKTTEDLRKSYKNTCLVVLATDEEREVMLKSGRPYALTNNKQFINFEDCGKMVVRLSDYLDFRESFSK